MMIQQVDHINNNFIHYHYQQQQQLPFPSQQYKSFLSLLFRRMVLLQRRPLLVSRYKKSYQCFHIDSSFVQVVTCTFLIILQFAILSHATTTTVTTKKSIYSTSIPPSIQQQQQQQQRRRRDCVSLLQQQDRQVVVASSRRRIRLQQSTTTTTLLLLFQKIRGGADNNDDIKTNPLSSSPATVHHNTITPVTIHIRTNTGSSIIDPTIELPLVNPLKRTILSLKQSIQRQLTTTSSSGKPPISSLQLIYQGQILTDDDVLLADILDEDDDDDDEETSSVSTKDGKPIIMILDMIPPVVDSKNFIYDIESKLDDITTSELLRAYAINEAIIQYNTQHVESLRSSTAIEINQGDDDERVEQPPKSSSSSSPPLISVQIRERAQQIENDMIETLFQSSQSQKLLSETETPKQKLLMANAMMDDTTIEVRGNRIRHAGISGIRGNYIRFIQHELNIENWYQAMKHCILFLFFGYFGGRTTISRTILFMGAPIMILIQTRFMKLYLRQLLYTILYNPPLIILSLLPAPQQAILSLNLSDSMKQIYGEHIIIDELTEQLLKDDPSISNDLSKVLTSKRFTVKTTSAVDEEDEEDAEEEDGDDDEEENDDADDEEDED